VKIVALGMALASSVTCSSFSFAADMAVKAAHPALNPVYNWTGFYIGAHAGYNWTQSTDVITPASPNAVFFDIPGEIHSPNPLDPHGFIGGGQAGYNWQVSPMWVAGLEADISGLDSKRTTVAFGTTDASRIITASEKMDWFGTVRGRFGITPTDRLLVYATGGLAYGQVNLATALTRTTGCVGNNCQQGSVSETKLGWTVGGGVEWALANNWSLKGEYLYYDLGSSSHLMTDPFHPSTIFAARADFKGSIARAGLNYHFGGPVVAKY
jgi:outer membrane immunogenic protein